jgi:hypothetical protein
MVNIIKVKDVNKILLYCSKNTKAYKGSIVTDEKEIYYSDGDTFWEIPECLYTQIKQSNNNLKAWTDKDDSVVVNGTCPPWITTIEQLRDHNKQYNKEVQERKKQC